MGLESEARATVRYSTQSGQFTAMGHILRVAAGPPVTVTLKRLSPMGADSRRTRTATRLPVSVRVVTSSVTSSLGQEDMPGWTENVSETGMLLATSLLLAVGDVLRLALSSGPESVVVSGRVTRVQESEDKSRGQFGVGVEIANASDTERARWAAFVARIQRQERK